MDNEGASPRREVWIDARSFDRDVVYRAGYALTDRAWLWLEPGDAGVRFRLTAKEEGREDELVRELGNLLLDFALRKQVAAETGEMRDLLLRRALAGGGT